MTANNIKEQELLRQNVTLKDALYDIKVALQANTSSSKEELFECCANAFQIAERAQKKTLNSTPTLNRRIAPKIAEAVQIKD